MSTSPGIFNEFINMVGSVFNQVLFKKKTKEKTYNDILVFTN